MSNNDNSQTPQIFDSVPVMIPGEDKERLSYQEVITRHRLQAAVDMLDDMFGPEYSKKNPALVATVLNALLQVQ